MNAYQVTTEKNVIESIRDKFALLCEAHPHDMEFSALDYIRYDDCFSITMPATIKATIYAKVIEILINHHQTELEFGEDDNHEIFVIVNVSKKNRFENNIHFSL